MGNVQYMKSANCTNFIHTFHVVHALEESNYQNKIICWVITLAKYVLVNLIALRIITFLELCQSECNREKLF